MPNLNGNSITVSGPETIFLSVRSNDNCQGNIVPIVSGTVTSGPASFVGYAGGVAQLSVTGTGTIQYNLSLGSLANGNYKLVIGNQAGDCYFCEDVVVNCGGGGCVISVTEANYECYTTGQFTATFLITGGSGNYQWSGDGGTTFSPTSANFSQVFTSGLHIIQIRDASDAACNKYVPLSYSATCESKDFCNNFSIEYTGDVNGYDKTFIHSGASGTVYWSFNDRSINDVLRIYKNGTLILTTSNTAGLKTGNFALNFNDTIRIIVTSVSTVNGGVLNSDTYWDLFTKCSEAYPSVKPGCSGNCINRPATCQIEIISVEPICETALGIIFRGVKVRARRLCPSAGTENYQHQYLKASLSGQDGSSFIFPTSFTDNTSTGYAEWIFSVPANGNYTAYVSNGLVIGDYTSQSGTILNCS